MRVGQLVTCLDALRGQEALLWTFAVPCPSSCTKVPVALRGDRGVLVSSYERGGVGCIFGSRHLKCNLGPDLLRVHLPVHLRKSLGVFLPGFFDCNPSCCKQESIIGSNLFALNLVRSRGESIA